MSRVHIIYNNKSQDQIFQDDVFVVVHEVSAKRVDNGVVVVALKDLAYPCVYFPGITIYANKKIFFVMRGKGRASTDEGAPFIPFMKFLDICIFL